MLWIMVPHWFVAAITIVLPLLWAVARRNHRLQSGTCRTCHYNLAGNTSGVCPECGSRIAPGGMMPKANTEGR